MAYATDPGYDIISYINFTGGFPTYVDFIPSIVFLVAYALSCPLLLLRTVRKQDRTTLLIRPSVFLGCRIASLVIRAMMAKTAYGIGLLIAELVLISVGYLVLIAPLITLWKYHVASHTPKAHQPWWIKGATGILWVLLWTAIIAATVSGAITSKAFDSDSAKDAVRALRETSYVLSLAVVTFLVFVTIWSHFHFGLPLLKTVYLLMPDFCLLIVATYRVAQTFESNPLSAGRSKAAFWVLQMAFEFLAWIFVLGVSLPTWYPGEPKIRGEGRTVAAEKGRDLGRSVLTTDHVLQKRPWYMKGLIMRRFGRDKYYDQ